MTLFYTYHRPKLLDQATTHTHTHTHVHTPSDDLLDGK